MTGRLAVIVGPELEPVLVEHMTLEQAREAVHVMAAELENERARHAGTLNTWRTIQRLRRSRTY